MCLKGIIPKKGTGFDLNFGLLSKKTKAGFQ